ncbi:MULTISPECIES: hypothetical protein [Antrihabitans]|jgi:hypothetical protein|uniref:Uncharacterized protein n=2 Tax=Antrihabitans TaxID=2799491 RepID=A0A934NNA5_9NOCA|nr:hypothetical protein [Antrihabitans stalagmiti]MBJ8338363.1 hypothetical protein [Antrihabitans stalagmiti]
MALTNTFAVFQTVVLAAWFGAMVYSIVVVQQFQLRVADPESYEDVGQLMASGSRRRILRLAFLIGVSGTGLAISRATADPGPSDTWVVLMCVKLALYVVACSAFAYQSWWVWPRRIFALPAEMPAVRRTFLITSLVMATALGLMLAVDVIAATA